MGEVRPWGAQLGSAQLRKTILRMANAGGSAHLGSSLSLVEILAVLYQDYVRLNWEDRGDRSRDILGLSKGHGVMALYACFAEFGWIGDHEIEGYFGPGNQLKGLASVHVPGIEVSGGSLGHGLSVCTGMALAAQLQAVDRRVFAVLGDGELNEGSVWESLAFAAHRKLRNLVVIIDANGYQAMGKSSEVLDMESYQVKLEAFGLETWEVDGHDRQALKAVFTKAVASSDGRPKAVVARTIKGKGISFMENNNEWHYQRLEPHTFAASMKELA